MDFDTYNGIRVIADEVATRLTIKFSFLIGALIIIIVILFFILYYSRTNNNSHQSFVYPDTYISRPFSYDFRQIPTYNSYKKPSSNYNYSQNQYSQPYYDVNNSQNQNSQLYNSYH